MQFDALGAYRGKASDIQSLLLPLNQREGGSFFKKQKEENRMSFQRKEKLKSLEANWVNLNNKAGDQMTLPLKGSGDLDFIF